MLHIYCLSIEGIEQSWRSKQIEHYRSICLGTSTSLSSVWCSDTYLSDSRWWNGDKFINVSSKVLPIEEGVNLSASHEEVRTSELRDVCHIDIEKCRNIGDNNGLIGSSWR